MRDKKSCSHPNTDWVITDNFVWCDKCGKLLTGLVRMKRNHEKIQIDECL